MAGSSVLSAAARRPFLLDSSASEPPPLGTGAIGVKTAGVILCLARASMSARDGRPRFLRGGSEVGIAIGRAVEEAVAALGRGGKLGRDMSQVGIATFTAGAGVEAGAGAGTGWTPWRLAGGSRISSDDPRLCRPKCGGVGICAVVMESHARMH